MHTTHIQLIIIITSQPLPLYSLVEPLLVHLAQVRLIPSFVPRRTVHQRLLLRVPWLVVDVQRSPQPAVQEYRRHVRDEAARWKVDAEVHQWTDDAQHKLEQHGQQVRDEARNGPPGRLQTDLGAPRARGPTRRHAGHALAEAHRVHDRSVVRNEDGEAADLPRRVVECIFGTDVRPCRITHVR